MDGSDWQPLPEDFDDHVHLSRQGAYRFSAILGGELSRTAYQ
jgi:hypothetical protein